MNGKKRNVRKGLEVGMPGDSDLTGQERMFCLEYYRTGNKELAIKKAGYEVKNSQQLAQDLLADHRIKAYTKAIAKVHEQHVELERERFIDLLKVMAVTSIADFMDDWENLKPMKDIPEEHLHAVREINVTDFKDAKGKVTRTKTVLKLADKQPYLDMWAKIRNFYQDHNTKSTKIEVKFT